MTKQPRPQSLNSTTIEMPCPCGNVYVTVTIQNGNPFEIFARLGKNGGCAAAVVSGICSTMSIGLRSGVNLIDLATGLESISCHRNQAWFDGKPVVSCVDAIAKAVKEVMTFQED
jgi:ribonucleoside-diphosphate reductase alpha chain